MLGHTSWAAGPRPGFLLFLCAPFLLSSWAWPLSWLGCGSARVEQCSLILHSSYLYSAPTVCQVLSCRHPAVNGTELVLGDKDQKLNICPQKCVIPANSHL
jgi:hypothetical protein